MDVGRQIFKFLNVVRPDKLPVEIRILRDSDPALSGVYDFYHRALIPEHIAEYDDHVKGIYFGLNAPDWPVSNCLQMGKTVGNDNIPHRNLLFFDFDPVRFGSDGARLQDQEVPSTEPEKLLAMERAKSCRQYLMDRGAPDPILGDSGNGGHLLWMLDIDREVLGNGSRKDAVSLDAIYSHLQQKFSDERVTFDVKVKNAGRICKLYGSLPHKGSNTEERPWRRSKLIEVPDDWAEKPFPHELIQSLTPENRTETSVEVEPEDVTDAEFKDDMQWLHLFLKSSKAKVTSNFICDPKGFRICVQCPLVAEHSSDSGPTQTAIFMERGKGYSFFCHHAHAEAIARGETMDWAWFRKQVESEDLGAIEVEEADNRVTAIPRVEYAGVIESDREKWQLAAAELDIIREGKGTRENPKGEEVAYSLPDHVVDESILDFVIQTLQRTFGAKFFVADAPYLFLPGERAIYKFLDSDAQKLLSRFKLRLIQRHTSLVEENLRLHILMNGEQTHIHKFGCLKGEAVYVYNGRGGIFKITSEDIIEVPNGTDGVYMKNKHMTPWPAFTPENYERMAKGLQGMGGRIGDTKLSRYFRACWDESTLPGVQYEQMAMFSYLSLFLSGVTALRPARLAIGPQNSGKSTLWEKHMWLFFGVRAESGGLPTQLRSFIAAVSNHEVQLFDNLDRVNFSDYRSDYPLYLDIMCKCCTGGKLSLALLYKNNIDKEYDLRCNLFLSSRINPIPSHCSDMLRRTLTFPFRKPTQEEHDQSARTR